MNLEHLPISELSLPLEVCEKLSKRGIETAHDLILAAYMLDQRRLLAEHVGIPVYEFDELVHKLLESAPQETIQKLAERAKEIRSIPSGILPPSSESTETG